MLGHDRGTHPYGSGRDGRPLSRRLRCTRPGHGDLHRARRPRRRAARRSTRTGTPQRAQLRSATLRALQAAQPADANDRVTIAALRDELEVDGQLRALGEEESELNNIGSPVQQLRDVFDLMPTEHASSTGRRSRADWPRCRQRSTATSPRCATPPARGHVRGASPGRGGDRSSAPTTSARTASSADGRARAAAGDGELPDVAARRACARRGARRATPTSGSRRSCATSCCRRRPGATPVGRERYVPHSRQFLGAARRPGRDLRVGAGRAGPDRRRDAADRRAHQARRVRAPRRSNCSTPTRSRQLEGTDALQAWMQEKSDAAVDRAGRHALRHPRADPPARVPHRADAQRRHLLHRAERRPRHPAGPDVVVGAEGRDRRSRTWRELTTVYHEGVPGHHLQIAQTVYRRDLLNRWRRLGVLDRAGTARAGRCTPSG